MLSPAAPTRTAAAACNHKNSLFAQLQAASMCRRHHRVHPSTARRHMHLEATRVPSVEAAVLVDAGTPYLDVRTPEEHQEGHPRGAINIPFLLKNGANQLEPNPEFVSAVQAAFHDPTEQIIVGCRSGSRSARACALLEAELQFSNLVDDAGGWLGWVDAQLPAEK